ncbi:electron transfer flavoprotein subunit beta/FixA family protein [bacterium]|nr:electron transfer flavoprotein subunit beta/FixA family protein [bacterium]MBU3955465.1 electron transfer flavoprotein subunit beta/FixA family protein [bacterium]MBU4134438.1 electron transfer flavoprotein subunit beta/FixA family protein [bacterium]
MNFIVCVKQVPATTDVKINPETNTLIREGVEAIVNPFDLYAVEEAVSLKEQFGGNVTALSMGPPQASAALKETISVGVDDAVLLSDRNFGGSDTLATAYTLARAIKKIGNYDMILCGYQAIDGDTAQVGPGIAEELGLPCVTYVKKIREVKDGLVTLERMMETGFQVIEVKLPILITVVKDINTPRLPGIRGKMKARKAEIPTWTAADIACEMDRIGQPGSPTWVRKIFAPPKKNSGKILSGEISAQAKELTEELKRLQLI